VLLSAPTETSHHAPGLPHVRSTVAKMAELASDAQDSYPIRNLATRITHGVPSKSPTAELRALYTWVRDQIRYRRDPLGTEYLQRPARTVAERAGDCDDLATLLAALAGSLGHRWRFRTVGSSPVAQAHVAAQAHDGSQWIELDPVLEPAPASVEPRPDDPGRFAGAAVGSDHLWDDGGRMVSALSGPTDARDRELWLFSAYFGNLPPGQTPDGGNIAPGTPATPDPRYRAPDAPGFYRGKPRLMALPAGAVPPAEVSGLGTVVYQHPDLGLGFLKKLGKLARKVTKLPGVSLAASVIPGGSAVLTGAKLVGEMAGGKKRKRRRKPKRKARGYGRARARARRAAPAAATGAPANYVTRSDLRDMRKDIMQLAELATKRDIDRLVRAMGGRPKRKTKRKTKRKAAASRPPRRRRARRRSTQRARPRLRRGLPRDARQLLDRRAGLFRVYAKTRKGRRKSARKLSGLGMIRPTLSLSFGGVGVWDPSSPLSLSARDAARAVQRFLQRVGKPPAIRLAPVRAFQEAEPGLEADGLWGPNTQAAARWYLDGSGTAIPRYAPGFRGPVSWQPPQSPQTAPAPAVAPGPPPPPVITAPAPSPAALPPPMPAPMPAPRPMPPPAPVAVAPPPPPPPPPPPALKPAPAIVVAPPPPPPPPAPEYPAPPGYVQLAVSTHNPGFPPVGWEPTEAQKKDADTIARDTLRRAGVKPSAPQYVPELQRMRVAELQRMRAQQPPPASTAAAQQVQSPRPGRPTQAAFPGSSSARPGAIAPATTSTAAATQPAADSHPGLPAPPEAPTAREPGRGSGAMWLALYYLYTRRRAA